MYKRMWSDEEMSNGILDLISDKLEEKRIEGVKEGLKEGAENRDIEKITEMLNNGKTPEQISDFCNYPLQQVMDVYNKLLVAKEN